MLGKIFSAMRRALKAMLRFIARLKGGIFGGGGGVEIIEDDDGYVPEPAVEKAVEKDSATEAYKERLAMQTQARTIIAYAADCQVDGRRPALAPVLTRPIKDWLEGLDLSQMRQITDAGAEKVGSHITEGPYIAGLPKVMRLPKAALVPVMATPDEQKAAWLQRGRVTADRVASLRL
jgi:carbamate kinase